MRNFVRLIRFFCWCFVLGLTGTGVIAASFYLYFSPHLPAVEQLREVQLETPLRIYTRDQQLIAEFGEKRRRPISLFQAPENLRNAFLAAEDSRFYDHHGVDIKGLLRASLQLISTGSIQTGGSTITMQAAKNFFLSQERTFTRKFKEILLAFKIEQTLEKDQIFELYLNKIYLGNRAYGVEAAANVYYGVSIDALTLAQSAMIAGLPKAPSRFNPLAAPERALIRRDWILDRMLELNMISEDMHAEARNSPITASYYGTQPDVDAPYIAEMARLEIVARYGADAYTTGYQAYVTVDSRLQKAADKALKRGLLAYSRRHGYKGIIDKLDPAMIEAPDTALEYLAPFPTAVGLVPGFVTEIGEQTAKVFTKDKELVELDWQALRWTNPYINVNKQGKRPKKTEEILAVGDVVYVSWNEKDGHMLAQMPNVQGALAALDPHDGAITALVGGFDFYLSKFNRATQAQRQPGSNFKPFIYLAALENGATAATIINDAPVVFEDDQLETSWRPENYSEKFYGPTRLRKALYLSRNLVSIRLLQKIGIKDTVSVVEKFGFDPARIPNNLSLALGSAAFTPLEIATGYAAIANGGFRVEPYLIDKILDHQGQVIFEANPAISCSECEDEISPKIDETNKLVEVNLLDADAVEAELVNRPYPMDSPPLAERVADPRSVFILNSVLQDVIKRGTAKRAQSLGRTDLAGKTGTTNDQVDAWFSGYNSNLAATVWVGFDQPSTLGRREYGGRAALPIWIDFMEAALQDRPEAPMKQPPGLVSVKIDPLTGVRAAPGQPDTIFEIFRKETAPQLTFNEDKARESLLTRDTPEPAPELIF